MSVRMRHTHSHTRNRRSHHALAGVAVVADKEGVAVRRSHRLDEASGTYRGRKIVEPKKKKERTKAEKHEHPAHPHTTQPQSKETPLKPEVTGTHEHGNTLPTSRRGI